MTLSEEELNKIERCAVFVDPPDAMYELIAEVRRLKQENATHEAGLKMLREAARLYQEEIAGLRQDYSRIP
jgi:hypothetical protein